MLWTCYEYIWLFVIRVGMAWLLLVRLVTRSSNTPNSFCMRTRPWGVRLLRHPHQILEKLPLWPNVLVEVWCEKGHVPV